MSKNKNWKFLIFSISVVYANLGYIYIFGSVIDC